MGPGFGGFVPILSGLGLESFGRSCGRSVPQKKYCDDHLVLASCGGFGRGLGHGPRCVDPRLFVVGVFDTRHRSGLSKPSATSHSSHLG